MNDIMNDINPINISVIIPHTTYENEKKYYEDYDYEEKYYEKYILYDPLIPDCNIWRSAIFDKVSSEEILADILYRQECLKTHIKIGIKTRDFSRKFEKYWNALKDTLTLGIKSYRDSKMYSKNKTYNESFILYKIGKISESIEYFTNLYFHTKNIWLN